jgi:hypothetical protein
MQLRNALWADDALRERFVKINPAGLEASDLALVASWQYRRAGSFFIVRSLKKYTVFLSEDSPPRAYGVLLPFEDQIIYDGLLRSYAIVFGPSIRALLHEDYRNAEFQQSLYM